MYDKPSICRRCKGQCCKASPGCNFPVDFGMTLEEVERNVRSALSTGRYCLDYWEYQNDEKGYYVRPAIEGEEGKLVDDSWGGTCTFLTKKGCSLASDKRPLNCRMLEPMEDGRCFLHDEAGQERAARAWSSYSFLKRLAAGLKD